MLKKVPTLFHFDRISSIVAGFLKIAAAGAAASVEITEERPPSEGVKPPKLLQIDSPPTRSPHGFSYSN